MGNDKAIFLHKLNLYNTVLLIENSFQIQIPSAVLIFQKVHSLLNVNRIKMDDLEHLAH